MQKGRAVQIVHCNYDIKYNPVVKELYPNLHREVLEHDKISSNSCYDLSEKAAEEFDSYLDNQDIVLIE